MNKKRIRILHVVGGMNRGGVETWLMHLLRNINRKRFRFDFMVHTKQPCAYDKEIQELGANIIPCMRPSRPWQYARNFKRIVKEHGPYDVVHSHVHHYSGFVLWLAQKANVPIRIAHSHSDTAIKNRASSVFRSTYLKVMELCIQRYATVGIACSQNAAASLFGKHWGDDARWTLLYCGIDLKPFVDKYSEKSVRNELGIMPDTLVVGHVGNFTEAKNHRFLVDIFFELLNREPKAVLLLIGDGPLRKEIEIKVERHGIRKKIIFAGTRMDVPRLMTGAIDVFVLPSLWEGLPLVLIEAQAATLPSVCSNSITNEVDLILPLVHRVSVKQPASVWAEEVIKTAKKVKLPKRVHAQTMNGCPFNIAFSEERLRKIYEV